MNNYKAKLNKYQNLILEKLINSKFNKKLDNTGNLIQNEFKIFLSLGINYS